MRCVMCLRRLNASAVPGLAIGPKCAKDRGLMPAKSRRVRPFDSRGRAESPDQVDWVSSLNAGQPSGEAP